MATASDIYTKHLLTKGHGYPLWRPNLDQNLPEEYIANGIQIGDIGVIRDGAFRYIFNICMPAEDPINCGNTPRNFQPLNLDPESLHVGGIAKKHIEHYPHGHRMIISTCNSNLQVFRDAALDVPAIPVGGSAELQIEAASEGAALILPDGSSQHDLKPVGKFRKYAIENGESWYQHINGTLGWDAPNGSLYMVTGCDKSKAWAVASFFNQEQGAPVSLKLVTTVVGGTGGGLSYSWKTQDSAEAHCYPELLEMKGQVGNISTRTRKHGSSATSTGKYARSVPAHQNNQNQCVFLRGFKITLRESLFWKILQPIKLSNIVDKGFNPRYEKSIPYTRNAGSQKTRRSSSSSQWGQTRPTVTSLGLEPPIDETDVLLQEMDN